MAYRFFTVPLAQPDKSMERLNRFLASYQVVEVDRQFHAHAGQAFWHFCVNYVPSSQSGSVVQGPRYGKVDYKEVLSEDDFVVYAKLRELRKQIAEELSIPVFAIFTNEQLAQMTRRSVDSITQLQEIDGIGPKKADAFGERFLGAVREMRSSPQGDGHAKGNARVEEKLF